jgi:hypothetical protein
MKRLATALAVTGLCASAMLTTATPAAALETYQAQMAAADAASQARFDMLEAFGPKRLRPGQHLWRNVPESAGAERVVISLSDQLAFLYRGNTLMAVSTISSGEPGRDTPAGVFSVQMKKPMHRSRKYDNAPMPFAQFITNYGVALHAGHNPGHPASHGCVRLPSAFAKKLYTVTTIGTPVFIGA